MDKKMNKNTRISSGDICNTLELSKATFYRFVQIRK